MPLFFYLNHGISSVAFPLARADTTGKESRLFLSKRFRKMFCPHCGADVGAGANFCSKCGKSTAVVAKPQATVPRQRTLGSNIGYWIGRNPVLAIIITVVGIGLMSRALPKEEDQNTAHLQPAVNSAISPKPTATLPKIPPPKFRLYKFKVNQAISYVVPIKTTDEQLKSLLWLFRQKVRTGGFIEIRITQPVSTQWGQHGYQSGMLLVYRGEKCANEQYISNEELEKGHVGPCGYGDHNDAYYQWGLDADPNKDGAAIMTKNGAYVQVFDYKDNWHTSSETLQKVDQKVKDQWNQDYTPRQQFAVAMTNEQNEEGIEIHAAANAGNPKQLDFESKLFNNHEFRQSFLTKVLPTMQANLCNAGFRSIRIVEEGDSDAGQSYPLKCSQ